MTGSDSDWDFWGKNSKSRNIYSSGGGLYVIWKDDTFVNSLEGIIVVFD